MRKFIAVVIGVVALIALPAWAVGEADAPVPTTSTTPAAKPDPCHGHTYVVSTYRRVARRIYHQRGRIKPKQHLRLRRMRKCAVSPAAHRSMYKITQRQSRARKLRQTMNCGTPSCNRRLGQYMITRRYGSSGWSCIAPIIDQESGWDHTVNYGGARGGWNGRGAYGIPQANPGSKMSSRGADWEYNPRTQIRWLMWYVDTRYGGPCGALSYKRSTGVY
jgi:hypothetical protein